MPFDFTGKKMLVTGAGRGLGRFLAKQIANAGGEVFALSRTKETLTTLVKESDNNFSLVADLYDWDATRAVLDGLGVLDGVVNNAAELMVGTRDALGCPRELFDGYLKINLLGPVNVIQSTARKMVEAGNAGSIVNVSR